MKNLFFFKRVVISILIVAILLSTISIRHIVTASNSDTTYDNIYTEATVSDMLKTCNTWPSIMKMEKETGFAGLKITANGGFDATNLLEYNMGFKNVFTLDDLTLRFKGYVNSNYFSIRLNSLGYNESTEWGPGGKYCLRVFMLHDFYKLYYRSTNTTTNVVTEKPICDGVPFWAGLQNKEWALHFSMNDDGSLNVQLIIEDKVCGQGDIPKEALDQHGINPQKVFLSFGFESAEVAKGTMYYLGYGSSVSAAIKRIDKIGAVNVDSQNDIAKARRIYDCVPQEAKQYVTNHSVLLAAEEVFAELQKKLIGIPSMTEMLPTCNTWSGLLDVTDVPNEEGTGVRIKANGGFDATNLLDYNMGSSVKYSLNDLTLNFKGYVNSNYLSIRFNSMGYNVQSGWGPGGKYCLRIFMLHDFYQLYYRSYNFETGITTEKPICDGIPRWAELQNKNWSLHFMMNSDGSLKVEFLIEGDVKGYGNIPKQYLDEHNINPESVYLSFGFESAETARGSVDFVSYSINAFRDVINKIDNMDANNRLDVLKVSTVYNELADGQKELVHNYSILKTAIDKLKEDKAKYDSNFKAPTLEDTNNVFKTWSDKLNVQEIPTGGLHYKFTEATVNMLEGLTSPYCMDGLTLKFKNYIQKAGEMAVLFGNKKPNPWPNDTATGLSVYISPESSSICTQLNYQNETLVVSPLLNRKTLSENEFEMSFEKKNDGSFIVRVIIYTEIPSMVEAVIPKKTLSSLDTSTVYFSLVSLSNTADIDFLGVKGTQFPIHVKEEIDDIGTVTLDSFEKILKAFLDYSELSDEQTKLVTNYTKLEEALSKYRELVLERDGSMPEEVIETENLIKLINISDINSIELYQAEISYEKLSDENMLLVSNFASLQKALKTYREKITKDVYPLMPYYGNSKLYNVTGEMLTEKTLHSSVNRFNWNNAILNTLDGTNTLMDMDGIYLKFSRYLNVSGNGKFAIYFSDEAAGKYIRTKEASEDLSGCCFALVFDTNQGKVLAYPTGEVIFEDASLKYKNFSLKTFSIELNMLANSDYFIELKLENKVLTSKISANAMRSALGLFNPNECNISLSSWCNDNDGINTDDKQTFSLDFVGLRRGNQHIEVQNLIDKIAGIITTDCKTDIEIAEKAYNTLPEYVKARVNNYSVLTGARFQLDKLKNNDEVLKKVEDEISAIGKVDIYSGDLIDAAHELFLQLTPNMQKKVKNAAVLQNAVLNYRKLTEKQWELDGAVYGWAYNEISSNEYFYNRESLAYYWNDQLTLTNLENGGLRFAWENAFRIVRTGKKKGYNLDGLQIQLDNFKKGEEQGRVAFLLGTPDTSWYSTAYEPGVYNQISEVCATIVLDTVNGSLVAYPNKSVIIQNNALKYDEISDKKFTMHFSKMNNGSFLVRLFIEGKTDVISGVLPTSVLNSAAMLLDTEDCMVLLSPWVNDESGRNDSSAHTMSIDVISVRQKDEARAFELKNTLEKEIKALPEHIDNDNKMDVITVLENYDALPTKMLKSKISNYNILAERMSQIHELEYYESYIPFVSADGTEEETVIPILN